MKFLFKELLIALLIGCCGLFFLYFINQQQLNEFKQFWYQYFNFKSVSEILLLLLKIIVIAPIIEEFIFRELLLGTLLKSKLSKLPRLFIHLIVALIFAGLHTFLQGFFGLFTFFPALYLGYLWQKHQSLLLNSIVHGMWNLLWIGFFVINF